MTAQAMQDARGAHRHRCLALLLLDAPAVPFAMQVILGALFLRAAAQKAANGTSPSAVCIQLRPEWASGHQGTVSRAWGAHVFLENITCIHEIKWGAALFFGTTNRTYSNETWKTNIKPAVTAAQAFVRHMLHFAIQVSVQKRQNQVSKDIAPGR